MNTCLPYFTIESKITCDFAAQCSMFTYGYWVLYEKIDQILQNKLNEPMHSKIGVSYMCIQRTHVLYSVVITWQSNPAISQFNSLCNGFTSVWSMFVYNTVVSSFVCVLLQAHCWLCLGPISCWSSISASLDQIRGHHWVALNNFRSKSKTVQCAILHKKSR